MSATAKQFLSSLLTLLFVSSLVVSIPSAFAATGSLVVTVYNVNGAPAASMAGITTVKLYDYSGQLVSSKNIDSNSQASWSGLNPGGYGIEVWHDSGLGLPVTELWGVDAVNVPSGGTSEYKFTRHAPVIWDIQYTSSTIQLGQSVTMSVTVKNFESSLMTCQVRLVLDRDKASSYDFDQTSAQASVAAGGTYAFAFTFTPSAAGTYYKDSVLYSLYGSTFVTDQWVWDDKPLTVTPPASSPPTPNLISPSDGATLTSTTVTFSWSSSSGAIDYQIEVNGPSSKLETVYSTSYLASLSPGSYTWRVRAHNSYGWSDWTSTWSFTITVPPPPTGSLFVTVYNFDATPLTPETLIVYDQTWKEVARANPESYVYTFSDLTEGTYNAEAYADDMFVGSVVNVLVQSGQATPATIQAQWPRHTLIVTVFYSDGSTRFLGATVNVYSWDGYNGRWNYRQTGTTDSNGQVSFLLWPTSITGEKYKVEIVYNSQVVGSSDNVLVDKNVGASISITTNVSAPLNKGSIGITVKYYDGSALTPETLILYSQNWQEIDRANPSSNMYIFSNLDPGTYHAETYCDDMFVGSAVNIPVVAGQTTDRTIQTQWPKRSLTATVFHDDGITPLVGATVKIYSWDGYNVRWNYRYQGTTDNNGQVSFVLWPTTISGEKYKAEVIYNSVVVGSKENVTLDKDIGGIISITTNVSIPAAKGSIKVTVKYYDGSALVPETLILYDENWQEVSRANPSSNIYIFADLSTGTYQVEAYADDMFIGSVENISVSGGQTTEKIIQTPWPKRTLTITVYYSDGATVFPDVTIKVYSWDGYRNRYNFRYEKVSESNGKASFGLWPTSITGEHYKVEAYYDGSKVGENSNVQVDKNTGSDASITTNVAPRFTISLSSKTTDGLNDIGTLTFDDLTYQLSTNAQKLEGTYEIKSNPPGSYSFHHWEYSGGVTVSNKYSQVSQASVTGNGQLTAVFYLEIRLFFSTGEEYFPLKGLDFDHDGYININAWTVRNFPQWNQLTDIDNNGNLDAPTYVYSKKEGTYRIIEYWIYYAYDNKDVFGQPAHHEHDFESIFVLMNDQYVIERISTTQHLWTNNYAQSLSNYYGSPPKRILVAVEEKGHAMILLKPLSYSLIKPDNSMTIPSTDRFPFKWTYDPNKATELYTWKIYDGINPTDDGFGNANLLRAGTNYAILSPTTAYKLGEALVGIAKWAAGGTPLSIIQAIWSSADATYYFIRMGRSQTEPILLKSNEPYKTFVYGIFPGWGASTMYIEAPWVRDEFNNPYPRFSNPGFSEVIEKGMIKIISWVLALSFKDRVMTLLSSPPNFLANILWDPVNGSIIDPSGKITGYKAEKWVNEINGTLVVWASADFDSILILGEAKDLKYRAESSEVSKYTLNFGAIFMDNSTIVFNAIEIPISPASIHEYEIDWDKLKRDQNGTTVRIDQDGDGTAEQVLQISLVLVADLVTPPTAVTVYDASDITENSVKLTWSISNEVDFAKYEIYISTSLGNIGTKIRTITNRLVTSFVVTGLSADTTYYFTIRVIDVGGLYADSDLIIVKTLPVSTVPIWGLLAMVIVSTLAVTSIIWGIKRKKRDENAQ